MASSKHENAMEGLGETMRVRLTFIDEVLGTASSDPNIYDSYIGGKGPHASEERAAVEESAEWYGEGEVPNTVFPREDGEPIVWDYQIKGCFKDACGMLRRAPGTRSSKLTAHKKVIDGLVFVSPRKIPMRLSGPEGTCQRPLRAQTAQGERISLACSETVPEGTSIEFAITCLDPKHMPMVREWLDYGRIRGFGQWRNSGKGRFVWEELG